MKLDRRFSLAALILASGLSLARSAEAQVAGHEMMESGGGWHFMQDGLVFLEFNSQGSERGGKEFVAPNWWMGMASRETGHGTVTLNGMFSLDRATVGRDGYRELFQTGEALDGKPLVDRQHPHDFFMQLSAAWRVPLTASTGLTIAAAPSGEPALGPVAFMHRRLGRRQSSGSSQSSQARFHARLVRRRQRGVRSRQVDGRGFDLQRA